MDKEFFLLFSVMDENKSWYLEENIEVFGTNRTNPEDEDFEESNLMHGNQCVWQRVCRFTRCVSINTEYTSIS